jgi:hypothetical protein
MCEEKKVRPPKATKNKAVARTANSQAEQNVVKIKDSGLRRNDAVMVDGEFPFVFSLRR